jgi:hypothetical protein
MLHPSAPESAQCSIRLTSAVISRHLCFVELGCSEQHSLWFAIRINDKNVNSAVACTLGALHRN